MTNPAAPGRTLGGRYHLQSLLARGGMASVWVADDTLLARRVAVKTLHPELAHDAAVRTRFRNEAIAVASLAHPDIVATYDTGEDEGVAYLVMELVDGPNLRRLLDQQGRLPVPDAVRIARGVTAALGHAHRNGIVHRDIKPANVLVPPHGPVKVTDFGIAKAEGSSDLTGTGNVVGTARYLSPEQLRGEPVDARCDLYAVGLLLFEMLAGRAPFTGDTETAAALARLSTNAPPLRSVRPDAPAPLEAITARLLAREPRDRFQDAAALSKALDSISDGAELHLPPPGIDRTRSATTGPVAPVPPRASGTRTATTAATPPRRPAPRKRAGWPWALLGALLLLGGVVGGFLAFREVSSSSDPPKSGGGATASAPQITGAGDFDPEGGDGENPGEVGLAIDGNPTTAWSTEHYQSRDFGGAKTGVGLRVELGSASDVHDVEVDTRSSGWNAQIYVAAQPSTTLAGWGSPVATGTDLGTSARFTIDPPAHGAAVLLWLTRLPVSGRLDVTEVRVG